MVGVGLGVCVRLVVVLRVELGAHGEQLAAVAPGGEDVLHHFCLGSLPVFMMLWWKKKGQK